MIGKVQVWRACLGFDSNLKKVEQQSLAHNFLQFSIKQPFFPSTNLCSYFFLIIKFLTKLWLNAAFPRYPHLFSAEKTGIKFLSIVLQSL